MVKTNRIEVIGQDVIATIKGVSVESTGRAVDGSLDECQAFCEQWLFEQPSIDASGDALDETVDGNPDWTLLHCRQALAVDCAMAAYHAAHKHAADNLSASPIC